MHGLGLSRNRSLYTSLTWMVFQEGVDTKDKVVMSGVLRNYPHPGLGAPFASFSPSLLLLHRLSDVILPRNIRSLFLPRTRRRTPACSLTEGGTWRDLEEEVLIRTQQPVQEARRYLV